MTEPTSGYPIRTLTDIVAIPDDAFPRFLAELPAIRESIKKVEEAAPQIAKETRLPWPLSWMPLSFRTKYLIAAMRGQGIIWTGDGKGICTVIIADASNETPLYTASHKMGENWDVRPTQDI